MFPAEDGNWEMERLIDDMLELKQRMNNYNNEKEFGEKFEKQRRTHNLVVSAMMNKLKLSQNDSSRLSAENVLLNKSSVMLAEKPFTNCKGTLAPYERVIQDVPVQHIGVAFSLENGIGSGLS